MTEKSDLEKALELAPHYRDETGHNPEFLNDTKSDFIQKYDFPGGYQLLRIVEKAYEQLQASGHNVYESLHERRFQIAELIADTIKGNADELYGRLMCRQEENELGDYDNADIRGEYLSIVANLSKLGEYLAKVYPISMQPDRLAQQLPEEELFKD